MKFIKETGVILSPDKKILHWVEGSSARVDIPQQLAWKLHKTSPGIVWAFAHFHPPNLTDLSGEDITTLWAWCLALHPWPFRFITLTEFPNGMFVETTYLGQLESFESWQARKETDNRPRKFIHLIEGWDYIDLLNHGYANLLWRRSYGR